MITLDGVTEGDLERSRGLDTALTESNITTAQYVAKVGDLTKLVSNASQIDGKVNEAHPSLNSFLNQINNKNRSMSIFVNSDSTGNDSNEWVYYFAEWLASNYPAYTVRYRVWSDISNVYLSPVNINTGTTSYFIDIWNFAVGGSTPFHCLNVNRKTKGLIEIINTTIYSDVSPIVDLCIINHGHNVNSPYANDNALRYALFTEEFILLHPYCNSFLSIRQNPNRDDYLNSNKIQWAIDWAKRKNFCIANVWDKFVSLNKAPYLYADNIHPSIGLGTEDSPTGTRLFLKAVTEQLSKKANFNYTSFDSYLNSAKYSFVFNPYLTHDNGDNATPSGFITVGGSASKDTSVFIDPKKGYSTKMVANGGTACYLEYTAPASVLNYLKGKNIIASVLLKTDEELTVNTYGRAILITDGMGGDLGFVQLNGSWNWRFTTIRVNPNAVYIKIRIYVDSANTVIAGKSINIDKVILSEGIIPSGYAI